MGNLNSDPMLPKPMKRTKFYCQERQDDDKYDTADETIKKTEILDKELQCMICDERFLDISSIISHIKSEHDLKKLSNQNKKMINCQVCGTEFDDHKKLEKHFESAHDVIKPSSHFEHENEDGANFQPLSSSNLQNIDIIEEINDTLKGSDDFDEKFVLFCNFP